MTRNEARWETVLVPLDKLLIRPHVYPFGWETVLVPLDKL